MTVAQVPQSKQAPQDTNHVPQSYVRGAAAVPLVGTLGAPWTPRASSTAQAFSHLPRACFLTTFCFPEMGTLTMSRAFQKCMLFTWAGCGQHIASVMDPIPKVPLPCPQISFACPDISFAFLLPEKNPKSFAPPNHRPSAALPPPTTRFPVPRRVKRRPCFEQCVPE